MTVDKLIKELTVIRDIFEGGQWVVGRLDTEYFVFCSIGQVVIEDKNQVILIDEGE